MILVDPLRPVRPSRDWPYTVAAHLVSDESLAELHAFARRIGLRRGWFQGDHYDLNQWRWERAVKAGAVKVSSRELVRRRVRVDGRVKA